MVGRTVGRSDGRSDGRTVGLWGGQTVDRSDSRTVGQSDRRTVGRQSAVPLVGPSGWEDSVNYPVSLRCITYPVGLLGWHIADLSISQDDGSGLEPTKTGKWTDCNPAGTSTAANHLRTELQPPICELESMAGRPRSENA